MLNEINIWGKNGCQLPDGRLCRACCYPLQIPEIKKPAGQDCPHESDSGCGIHKQGGYPRSCDRFHCHIFIDGKHPGETVKAAFVATRGLQLGYISPEQYRDILDKIARLNSK